MQNRHLCIFCHNSFDFNQTKIEHIIPNALGGKLRSKFVICSVCNEFYGQTIDKQFTSEFEFIAGFLNINTDRRRKTSIRIEKRNESDYYTPVIQPDGILAPNSKIFMSSEKTFYIHGKNHGEIDTQIKNISKGKTIKELINHTPDAVDGEVNSSIYYKYKMSSGSVYTRRAIAKMAAEYFIFLGGPPELISSISYFVNGISISPTCAPYYLHSHRFSPEPTANSVYHQIHLGKCDNILYAYIEIFSSICFLVVLNWNYHGPRVMGHYYYNAISGKMEEPSSDITIKREDFAMAFDFNDTTLKNMILYQKPLVLIMQELLYNRLIGKIITFEYLGFSKGTIITGEIAKIMALKSFEELDSGISFQ